MKYNHFENRGRIFRRTLTSGLLLVAGGFFASGAFAVSGDVQYGSGHLINPSNGCAADSSGPAIVGTCSTDDNDEISAGDVGGVSGTLTLSTNNGHAPAPLQFAAGAAALGDSSDTNNATLTFDETEVAAKSHVEVYGGYTVSGDATASKVTFSGADVSTTDSHSLKAVGGHSDSVGTAYENNVKVGGSTVVAGGKLQLVGGEAEGAVLRNEVSVYDSKVGGADGLRIIGGHSNAIATNNTVSIYTGSEGASTTIDTYDTQNAWIAGAQVTGSSDSETLSAGDPDAHGETSGVGNTVMIGIQADDATTFNNGVNIAGGWVAGTSAAGAEVHADGNAVIINGGTLAKDTHIYGGANTFTSVPDGANVTASYNTVMLRGGTFAENTTIVGGQTPTGGKAYNNQIILDPTHSINDDGVVEGGDGVTDRLVGLENVYLRGGWNGTAAQKPENANNSLFVYAKGLTVRGLDGFQHYIFNIDDSVASGDTMLTTLTDWTLHGNDLVNVTFNGAKQKQFHAGDEVGLVKVADGAEFINEDWDDQYGHVAQGPFLEAKGKVVAVDDGLELQFEGRGDGSGVATTVTETAKAPVEARVGTASIVSQATSMTTQGVTRAMAATANVPNASFGATSGGSLRLNSGSHVNLDSVGVMLGAAHRMGGNMVGGYFEFGYGSYTTHNNFSGNAVKGSGHNRYIGAGVLARHDWQDADGEGAYVSGGAHAGNVKSGWASAQLGSDYDTSSPYYGAQATGGYVLNLSERTDLDVYGQYAWTHVNGDSAMVGGAPFKFSSVDSQQLEVGTTVNYDVTKQLSGYAGIAWNHEFDGKAESTIYGQSTPTPSVKGSTGKLTAGVAYEPEGVTGLSLNVGLTGYTGKTEGVTGTLGAKFIF